MLAREYFFPEQERGGFESTTNARTLEDITYVLESVNRAASLSAYGIDKGWTTTSNPFQNGAPLPPVMTLHYERVNGPENPIP